MRYDPNKHHRQSFRLRGYDYSSAGAYFVTICAYERAKETFGQIENQDPYLSDAGWMVHDAWLSLPERFPAVEIDSFVIMPNHFHGIIVLPGRTQGPIGGRTQGPPLQENIHQITGKSTIGDIICAFKSITTVEYTRGVKEKGWPPFERKLWQRDYYEHIIRDEESLHQTRMYIEQNPAQWAQDQENPKVGSYGRSM